MGGIRLSSVRLFRFRPFLREYLHFSENIHMKNFILIILLIYPILSFAQGKDSPIIISGTEINNITHILRGDLFEIFKLEDIYKTELKRKMFLKTSEAKILRDSLAILREKIIAQTYAIEIPQNTGDYNLTVKGFLFELDKIILDSYDPMENETAFNLFKTKENIIENISFPFLPLEILKISRKLIGSWASKVIFISCNEKIAKIIEEKDIILRIIFNFTGDMKRIVENDVFGPEEKYYPSTKRISLELEYDGDILIEKKYR